MESKTAGAVALLTGVTLMAAGSQVAQAAVVTDTESFSVSLSAMTINPENDIELLQLDKFNPALGTLTGVRALIDSDRTLTADASSTSRGSPHVITSAEAILSVNFSSGGFFTSFGPSFPTVQAECSGSEQGCSDTQFNSNIFDGISIVNAGDFGDLTGIGTLDVQLAFSVALSSALCEGGPCTHSASLEWEGTVSIEYTYIPSRQVEVPEPGTLALLGLGLAGLGFARRRV